MGIIGREGTFQPPHLTLMSLASLSRGTFVLIETLAGEYIIGEAQR